MARPEDRPPTTVAVIDIGSNSGRVVVYRYQAGGHLQLLAGSRASLRLVRELDETHRLGDEAIARAFEAVSDFNAIAQGTGADSRGSSSRGTSCDGATGAAALTPHFSSSCLTKPAISSTESSLSCSTNLFVSAIFVSSNCRLRKPSGNYG